MLERSQSLLQNYNNIASMQDWYSTDHGSHTPLQDDWMIARAGDGAGDGAAAQKQQIVNAGGEHRDGMCKLSETSKRWTSLGTSPDERIMTAMARSKSMTTWNAMALVPEELEKHLVFNSNRLRTFEDACLEVVTYVEAKFVKRIRDSKSSDAGSRGHSDPVDVDAVNSLSSGKRKWSSSSRDGCFTCGGAHFQ